VEKVTTIKERILLFADLQENSKQIFFKKTGLNYDNFKGKSKTSALGSDSIVNIFTTYPEINLEWLITGRGNMLKSEQKEQIVNEPQEVYGKPETNAMLELIKHNRELTKENGNLREELGKLKNSKKTKTENA